jgi:hypothetical protein
VLCRVRARPRVTGHPMLAPCGGLRRARNFLRLARPRLGRRRSKILAEYQDLRRCVVSSVIERAANREAPSGGMGRLGGSPRRRPTRPDRRTIAHSCENEVAGARAVTIDLRPPRDANTVELYPPAAPLRAPSRDRPARYPRRPQRRTDRAARSSARDRNRRAADATGKLVRTIDHGRTLDVSCWMFDVEAPVLRIQHASIAKTMVIPPAAPAATRAVRRRMPMPAPRRGSQVPERGTTTAGAPSHQPIPASPTPR